MKALIHLLAGLFWILATSTGHAKELRELKVLFVGSERASDFIEFLKEKVAKVEATPQADFKPGDADSFDVVLLDWPQSEATREMRKLTSPLGTREAWNKPTVLLGSAGLNLAVAWKLKGGSGCTCMDPLAYDLRDHEIFNHPLPINRNEMVTIPTPRDFQSELTESEIQVLPLVKDEKRTWKAGWCTYSKDFAQNPDVEFFCGGVNRKTPTAAGLWRQANLLHFGFELSPSEMNENAQRLLLNSIAYISRFSEDRPIAITHSVFAGPIAYARSVPARWLRNPEYQAEWVKDLVAPGIWGELSRLASRDEMADWCDRHSRYFHPTEDHRLKIDEDLVALELPFDASDFIDKNLDHLDSSDPEVAARAHRLLRRYVPSGPETADSDDWSRWWKENRPYAFPSDSGDYCWYIDPLAKQRGVPSSKLRGPLRADRE